MRNLTDPSIVSVSVNIYRLLLGAYPAQFQQDFGFPMSQVFRDSCMRTFRQAGTNGLIRLWAITLLDLAQSVLREHIQRETHMKQEMRPEDIRRAGWALILGAVSFVLGIFLAIVQYANGDWSFLALLSLVFVSLPLLVFGVLGLRSRYGEKAGRFGRDILLAGAILGPVTSVLGFFLMAMEPFWFVIYAGPAVLFICLTLFGVAALYTKPMPRWNGLPVIAGLSYPALILAYIITSLMAGDWSSSSVPDVFYSILVTIQGIALLALGYSLKADAPEENVVTA